MKGIKKYLMAFGLCLVMFLTSACGSAPSNSKFRATGTHWTVGFAKGAIAPEDIKDKPYYIAGYRGDNPATGILDPQYARAVWLDDNSGRGGIVIVSVDCIGLSRTDVNKIRKSLKDFQKESGCRAIHIICTHTHAGIDTLGLWGPAGVTGKSDEFMDILYDEVRKTVIGAYKNRKDGKLYIGSVEIDNLQRDSRQPEVYDSTLTRLRFVPDDGSKGIQIINFAAHPGTLKSENSLVSADFPGHLGQLITEATGDEFMFINGAIGGQISIKPLKDSYGNELAPYDNLKKSSEILAEAVLGIDNERLLEPSLNNATEVFTIPLENHTYVVMCFLGVISTRPVKGEGIYNLAVETEVTYLEIGNVKILLIPGEIFPELVYGGDNPYAVNESAVNPRPLCDIVGDENLLIFALSNDEIGYIVPPRDFLVDDTLPYFNEAKDQFGFNHYHETNSVGPGAAPALAEAVEKLMNRLDW